jgi:hypothetical protein
MITGNYTGNLQVPVCQTLANTTKIAIGAAMADDSLTLASFSICNDNAGTVVAQLYWWDAANTTEHLVWQKSIATDVTEIVADLPLRLRTGDEIRIIGNSSVYVTLVYIMNFAMTRQ